MECDDKYFTFKTIDIKSELADIVNNDAGSVGKASQILEAVFEGQKSKTGDQPAASHSYEVMELLRGVGEGERVLVAALLHDVIEDVEPYGQITISDLRGIFGEAVAAIVELLSEDKTVTPWQSRKSENYDRLQTALESDTKLALDALKVKLADMLHNLTREIDAYPQMGLNSLANGFHSTPEQRLARYTKYLDLFDEYLSEFPLIQVYRERLIQYRKLLHAS